MILLMACMAITAVAMSETIYNEKVGTLINKPFSFSGDLKIIGNIDARDIDFLRWEVHGYRTIDLSDVNIVSSKYVEENIVYYSYYYEISPFNRIKQEDGNYLQVPTGSLTSDSALSSGMFMNILEEYSKDTAYRDVRKLILPHSVDTCMSDYIFSGIDLDSLFVNGSMVKWTGFHSGTFKYADSYGSIYSDPNVTVTTSIKYVDFSGAESIEELYLGNEYTHINRLKLPQSVKFIHETAGVDTIYSEIINPEAIMLEIGGIVQDWPARGDSSVIYVPKGTTGNYRNSIFKNFKIIESSEMGDTGEYPVSGISLDRSTLDMGSAGETAQLVATIEPEDATDPGVRWWSSDENVCRVSDSGLVEAVDDGCAAVVATTNDGCYVAACIVNVNTKTMGVAGAAADNITVYAHKRVITVDNKPAGESVAVYTPSGMMVYDGIADKISVESGIYIVRTCGQAWKIMVE